MKDLFRIISHRFQKNKKKSVSVLAIIITFVMVYSLIMPAVAIERDAAEKEPGMTIEETASESVAAEAMAEAEPASLEAEEAVTEEAAVEESAADEAAVEEPAVEEIQTESAAPAAAPADNSAADNGYVAADTSAAQQDANTGAAQTVTGAAAQADANQANADSKADPSDSDTKSSDAEEEMPAQNFEQVIRYKELIDEDGNTVDKQIKVVVDAAKDTFPAGTTMKAELILDNADVEKAVEDAVKLAAGELADATSIVQYRAVDITFADKDGQKVEPAKKVEVRITSDKIAEIVNPMLVHVNVNDQNGRVINADVFPKKDVSIIDEKPDTIADNENTMLFKASRFSPYVIVESQTIDEEGDAMHGLNGVEENADKGAEAADGKSGSVADGVLIAESDNYTVTIQFDETANIPEDAEIEINEIPEASRQYQSYMSEAEKLLVGDADTSKAINYAKVVDVNIVSASEGKVTPDADVDVDIAYKETEEIAEGTVMQALSFNGRTPEVEENALVYGGETYVDGLQVTTDKMPAYAIVGTETLTTQYITADGQTYSITVTYGPDAQIPSDATLSVREITKGTDEYFLYYNKALRAAGLVLTDPEIIDETAFPTESTVEVHEIIPFMPDARFFDVSIMVDGEKFEPKAEVEVKVEYDESLEMGSNDTVSAVHFTDEGDELLDAQVSENAEKQVITHSQEGFSVTGDVVISMTGDANPNDPGTQTAEFTALRAAGTNAGPETTKTVTDNGDGTYKIRLDILGEVEHETEVTKANVIIILDTSGSMDDPASGRYSRWDYAEAAVNNVASTLLGKNGQDGNPNDLIEMALVTFSNTATTRVASTTRASDIRSALSSISPDGGTNWEDALQEAASVTFNNDGDATYVIFVSDGNPTFRNTRGSYDQYFNEGGRRRDDWYYYNSLRVYGTGSELNETVRRCYNEALDDAQALVSSGRQLYTIGAFGNVTRMQSLTTEAGAPANHYYSASNADALSRALNEIAEAIEKNMGYTDVSTIDGITGLSSVSANVVEGQATGFKYYKDNVAWNDAPEAKYENSAVTWDLSSLDEPLEDGVTYSVEFDVWPSQESYDLIADLNNGLKDYDSLPQTTKNQINDNGDGTYTLKTNTSLTTTYTKNGVTGTDEWDKGENAMPLPTEKISIKKIWNNKVDEHIGDDTESVQLYLTKDGQNYLSGDKAITVGPGTDTEWVSTKDIFISVGLISQESDGSYIVREDGHDYSIAEPESFSYYWNLTSDVYRPMSINGTPHYLVLNDDASGTDGRDYYVIKGHKYEVREGDSELTATNDRRSNLNLTKVIDDQSDDQGADKDTLFEYTITVNNSNVENGKASDMHSDYYVWFSVYDPDHEYRTGRDANLVDDATLETSDNVIAESGNTGYFYVPSGTPFTVKIKEGWNLRAINLPVATTYSIVESAADGWEFERAEGSARNYETDPASSETYNPTVNTGTATVSGNIPNSNRSYTVAVTNKWKPTKTLTVNKSWAQNSFVTAHGDINVALFKVVDGAETYIEGSVRTIEAPDTSVTYNVSSLGNDVVVREVTVTTETTGEGDEAVTTTNVTPVAANGVIAVEDEKTTLATSGGATDTYIVTYSQGTASSTARTDTITNTMPMLSVSKTDMSGKSLGSAKFTLTDEAGNVVADDLESTTAGVLISNRYLSNGIYYLTETEAPAGYKKLTYKVKVIVSTVTDGVVVASQDGTIQTPYEVTLSEDKLSYGFAIANSDGTELPNTGGPGTLLYTLSGIALMLGAALMYGFRMRRRERRLN